MTLHGRPAYEMRDPAMTEYLDGIGRIPLLSPAEELRLGRCVTEGQEARDRLDGPAMPEHAERARLLEVVRAGDEARATMIRANLRLVVTLARRLGGRHVPLLDLIQEGNIGLMRAVEKFDYRRGLRFSTYATWWIRQAVTRAGPVHRTIRVPHQSYDAMIRCRRARDDIEERRGAPASDREVAEATGLTEGRVRALVRSAAPPLTLDVSDEPPVEPVAGASFDPWQRTVREDLRRRVAAVVASLPDDARTVVRMRFGFDGPPASLRQVSERIGASSDDVRRIEQEALDTLRSGHGVDVTDLDESA